MQRKIKVLVACEESQAVCWAFRKKGHEAYSCDILNCSGGFPEWHIKGDAIEVAYSGEWDMMIAFPPCTYLSSVQTFLCRKSEQRTIKRIGAASFFMQLYTAPIPKIAIENPTGVMTHIFRKPDQIVHPYYFGDSRMKRTCLWLKGLPKLVHREQTDLFAAKTYGELAPPSKTWVQKSTGKTKYMRDVNRPFLSSQERSKLSHFLANAMAEQWGQLIEQYEAI